MAQPARFTFDLDLAMRPAPPPPPMPMQPMVPEDLVAELMAQAREEAYAEGVAAGERNATAYSAQTMATAATALAARTAEMIATLDDTSAAHLRESVELAASIGRKLAVHLLARYPVVELDALIAECMASLEHVPHLVIRCSPDIADRVRDIATGHMSSSGFAGRLVVLGDPDIRLGDGRLEWVEGGLVRDINAISKQIDSKISAYLTARSGQSQEEEHP
jgi:flagellar assembly protein FliH